MFAGLCFGSFSRPCFIYTIFPRQGFPRLYSRPTNSCPFDHQNINCIFKARHPNCQSFRTCQKPHFCFLNWQTAQVISGGFISRLGLEVNLVVWWFGGVGIISDLPVKNLQIFSNPQMSPQSHTTNYYPSVSY